MDELEIQKIYQSIISQFLFLILSNIQNGDSSMYPYHNKIKQRIKNRELIDYEYVDSYNNIRPCLLLHFITEPKIKPIRAHRFEEYEKIFNEIYLK